MRRDLQLKLYDGDAWSAREVANPGASVLYRYPAYDNLMI
jgi:hypothetical protein